MTPEQEALVQASFAKVAPIAEPAAEIFYQRLFALDPNLRALFAEDMTEQRRKLMAMLGSAVANLNQWASVAPLVRAMGLRHRGYGVRLADYDTVGAALIATLETGLGDAFTEPVRQAWFACYALVAGEMIAGAEPPNMTAA